MEGVVRATGEQAAAAQDAAHESSRTVTQLQQQLADLKDK
jgi:polyhydroxyalkanoate synthesis regulator phasin